ncbi:uridine phosphorylase [Coprinopsis sp. MPI-PUGE-AT-0042]|nr:uridine phosphorylase [Coprinopsis sp. MPI-PUGE-AT-0042]
MKDTLTDANFPRTADLRVYHLGLKPGEVANRIITVGSPSRANGIATLLDKEPKPFVLTSERGFLTITGRFRNVPISIISIGMGSPNMDFFVREVRECVSGDMAIIRLGSCGGLVDIPVGSVVIPRASVAVPADPELHEAVHKAVEAVKPPASKGVILTGTVNASADSFYSSQGRQTSFPDHNEGLIAELTKSTEAATLEMETFHLFHLARCWGAHPNRASASEQAPLTTNAPRRSGQLQKIVAGRDTVIRAAAAQMVFAARVSKEFISPQEVSDAERWTGEGVLTALAHFVIPQERLHPDPGSVWEFASGGPETPL